jgi:hypothetical protein
VPHLIGGQASPTQLSGWRRLCVPTPIDLTLRVQGLTHEWTDRIPHDLVVRKENGGLASTIMKSVVLKVVRKREWLRRGIASAHLAGGGYCKCKLLLR